MASRKPPSRKGKATEPPGELSSGNTRPLRGFPIGLKTFLGRKPHDTAHGDYARVSGVHLKVSAKDFRQSARVHTSPLGDPIGRVLVQLDRDHELFANHISSLHPAGGRKIFFTGSCLWKRENNDFVICGKRKPPSVRQGGNGLGKCVGSVFVNALLLPSYSSGLSLGSKKTFLLGM